MKRLLSILLTVISAVSYGQGIYTKTNTNIKQQRMAFDSVIVVPRDTSPTNLARYPNISGSEIGDSGRLAFVDRKLWIHKGALGWKVVASDLPESILDSARRSNDTLYFRTAAGEEIAVKMEGIKISGVVGLQDSLSARYTKAQADNIFIPASQKGVLNGVATLGNNAMVPTAQLGSGTADDFHSLFGDQTYKTVVKSIQGQYGDVTLDWNQIMAQGSNTSRLPIVARDDEGFRIQQATAGASKNNIIRFTTTLNARELALIGYRENITGDSTFFILNRSGDVGVEGLSGNDILKVNGNTAWNDGNVTAGTGISFLSRSIINTGVLTFNGSSGAVIYNPTLQTVMTNGATTASLFTFNRTLASTNQLMDWQQGYGVYSDNIGTGPANSRLWINAPNGGDMILGPRAGASALNLIRLRGNTVIDSLTTMSGGIVYPEITTTGNIALTKMHNVVKVVNSTHVITLPPANKYPGLEYRLINYNTGGNVTISSVNRDGSTTTSLPNNAKWTIQSDGTNWYVIQD